MEIEPKMYNRSRHLFNNNRFESFKMYDNLFGFLYNFKKLQLSSDYVLKTYCVNLENTLKHDTLFDIDSLDLFWELRILVLRVENFKQVFQGEKILLNYLKKN